MKQEDKELLLKDLCVRLPYGLKGKCEIDASYDTSFDTIYQIHKFDATLDGIKEDLLFVTPLIEDKDEQEFANEEVADGIDILDFNPYLRPISSMTEEEVDNLFHILKINEKNAKEWLKVNDIGIIRLFTEEGKDFYEIAEAIDYLNSIHIDYRELIEKGLALEAPEEIY